MSTTEKALRQAAALLRLAQSSNAHEAASAAAAAQDIMTRHALTEAMLALDGAPSEPEEPIENFAAKGAPLDVSKVKTSWKVRLASVIARANSARIYSSGGTIHLVGRPSDCETVRYLFGYLSNEVDRLCDREGRGTGKTWRNNFRLGVVDTISAKIAESTAKVAQEARASVTGTALVRVETGLVAVQKRGEAVEQWLKSNLKLSYRAGPRVRTDVGAREAGRKAGQEVVLNRATRALDK